MQNLFWNPLSINYLIEIIVIGVQAGFFGFRLLEAAHNGQDLRNTALLFLVFLADCIAIIFQFLAFALPFDYVDYALPWVGPVAAVGMAGLVLYAFYFNDRPLLGRTAERTIIAVFIAVVAFETWIALERVGALSGGLVLYREEWTSIPWSLGYLAAPVFFVAHLGEALTRGTNLNRRTSFRAALAAILLPTRKLDHDAAAARAFFYFCLTPLIVTGGLLARSHGLISWQTEEQLSSWLTVTAFSSFTLIYLNYVPERSSFRSKLVGLTLIAVLFLASGISWQIGSAYSDAYRDPNQLASSTAYRFERQPDGSYAVARIDYRFEQPVGPKFASSELALTLPFDFPFFGEGRHQLFISASGVAGFVKPPQWNEILHKFGAQPAIFLATVALTEAPDGSGAQHKPSGVYFDSKPESAVITWNNLASKTNTNERYTFQLRLYPNGAIEMAFADVPQKPAYDFYNTNAAPTLTGIVPAFQDRKVALLHLASDVPFKALPGQGLVENHYANYRTYLNRIYQPVALYIIAASLIILLVFPLFFEVNLIRPLLELITGVQKIMGGKLATNIKVFYSDEIGFLASAFNKMATAQNELVETLEEKVAQRTAEASSYAAKNARFEERDHLSRELHDAVSQTLFSSSLIADKLPELFEKNPNQALQALAQLRQLNKSALIEMRHLLLGLRSEKLSSDAFGKLLTDMVADIKQRYGIVVSLILDGDGILPANVQFNFYRIAQEALNNAAKHTDTKDVSVYFDTIGNQALLTVSDRGAGFKPDEVAPGHLGLQIMRERMEQIGGTLEIESRPGQGTRITATWIKSADV